MLKVYDWDEVACEVGTRDVNLPEDTAPHLVKSQWEIDTADPQFGVTHSEYERYLVTDLPDLTLITGRFGRDRQYMLWWGPASEKFADLLR